MVIGLAMVQLTALSRDWMGKYDHCSSLETLLRTKHDEPKVFISDMVLTCHILAGPLLTDLHGDDPGFA